MVGIDIFILEDLHQKQLKNKSLGTTPKRMFLNGEFNTDNWCGGDDLIRDFFIDIENENILDRYLIEIEDYYTPFICHVDRLNDTTYATIIFDDDLYYFSWYKNRGCIEFAKKNGEILKEDEYIDLLSVIIKTGYKFNI